MRVSGNLNDLLRRLPRWALPAAGVTLVAVCGLGVWLLAFRGGGSAQGSDVLGAVASPTAQLTLTPAATATPDTLSAQGVPSTPEDGTGGPAGAAASQPSSDPGPASESSMRMKIAKIGVDAPITVRVVGSDGQMGVPNGRFDVVWYDFSSHPGLGGYPGSGGNAVFAGHVDYHPNYEAVFWDLHLIGVGDIIEVDLPDGTAVRYSVQRSQEISPDADFSSLVSQTGQDIITIVTCQGTFNSATHQYDHRLVVRGIRVS